MSRYSSDVSAYVGNNPPVGSRGSPDTWKAVAILTLGGFRASLVIITTLSDSSRKIDPALGSRSSRARGPFDNQRPFSITLGFPEPEVPVRRIGPGNLRLPGPGFKSPKALNHVVTLNLHTTHHTDLEGASYQLGERGSGQFTLFT